MTSSAEPAVQPAPAPGANPFLSTPGVLEPEAPPPSEQISAPPAAAPVQPAARVPAKWRVARRAATPSSAAALPTERPKPARRTVRGAPGQVSRVQQSLLVPRPDVFAPPAQLRGVHPAHIGDATSGWFLLAAHGGAGVGLLARLSEAPSEDAAEVLPVGQDAGQLWPDPTLETTGAVVVVTRTTVSGLAKARDLAAQYLAGAAPPGTTLLGVVVVADQPGKPPAPVAASIKLIDGVFARTWQVPYVPEYRVIGPDLEPPMHPLIADVLTDIRALVIDPPAVSTMEGPTQ